MWRAVSCEDISNGRLCHLSLMSEHTTFPLLKHTRVCYLLWAGYNNDRDFHEQHTHTQHRRCWSDTWSFCFSPEYRRLQWNIKVKLSCALISSWTHSGRHKGSTNIELNSSLCRVEMSSYPQRECRFVQDRKLFDIFLILSLSEKKGDIHHVLYFPLNHVWIAQLTLFTTSLNLNLTHRQKQTEASWEPSEITWTQTNRLQISC